MCVEQYGLGYFEIVRIFYEIKCVAVVHRVFAQRDACGPHEGSGDLLAHLRRLITMKLHHSAGNTDTCRYDFCSRCIDKKQHGRDKGRQAMGQFNRTVSTDVARAWGIYNKAHRVRASRNGSINILFTGQTADFDSGSGHGSQSYAAARLGRPNFSS